MPANSPESYIIDDLLKQIGAVNPGNQQAPLPPIGDVLGSPATSGPAPPIVPPSGAPQGQQQPSQNGFMDILKKVLTNPAAQVGIATALGGAFGGKKGALIAGSGAGEGVINRRDFEEKVAARRAQEELQKRQLEQSETRIGLERERNKLGERKFDIDVESQRQEKVDELNKEWVLKTTFNEQMYRTQLKRRNPDLTDEEINLNVETIKAQRNSFVPVILDGTGIRIAAEGDPTEKVEYWSPERAAKQFGSQAVQSSQIARNEEAIKSSVFDTAIKKVEVGLPLDASEIATTGTVPQAEEVTPIPALARELGEGVMVKKPPLWSDAKFLKWQADIVSELRGIYGRTGAAAGIQNRQFEIERLTETYMRGGMSPEEARAEAIKVLFEPRPAREDMSRTEAFRRVKDQVKEQSRVSGKPLPSLQEQKRMAEELYYSFHPEKVDVDVPLREGKNQPLPTNPAAQTILLTQATKRAHLKYGDQGSDQANHLLIMEELRSAGWIVPEEVTPPQPQTAPETLEESNPLGGRGKILNDVGSVLKDAIESIATGVQSAAGAGRSRTPPPPATPLLDDELLNSLDISPELRDKLRPR